MKNSLCLRGGETGAKKRKKAHFFAIFHTTFRIFSNVFERFVLKPAFLIEKPYAFA